MQITKVSASEFQQAFGALRDAADASLATIRERFLAIANAGGSLGVRRS